jgi:dienelactone hydrolase
MNANGNSLQRLNRRHRRSYESLASLLFLAAICWVGSAEAYEIVSIMATRPVGSKNATITGELFKPAGGGPFSAVVLMHGCGGWQPAVLGALHAHALHFVDHGYVVLNLDSFGPRGNSGGIVCESDARLVDALDYRTYDALDALHFLQSLTFVDPRRIFLMGQSNGGSVAIIAAKQDIPTNFRAVAAYYPWCGALNSSHARLAAPLIIFSGGRDDWTPAWECRNKTSSGAALKVIEYPDAVHSFDIEITSQKYLGKRIGFDKSATEDSRRQMLEFFAEQSQTVLANSTD